MTGELQTIEKIGSSGKTRTYNPPVNRRNPILLHRVIENDQVLRLQALLSETDHCIALHHTE